MFAIATDFASIRLCINRRDFLRASLVGTWGVAGRTFSAPAPSDSSFGRAKRCIQVFLNGGVSQIDLWDMKSEAPAEYRGELNPIATAVPTIQLSELLPRVARQVDKFKIVRSITHDASVHTTAVRTMLTGTRHPTPTVEQTRATPDDPPHIGSIYASQIGWQYNAPPFVCLPTLFRAPPVDGVWPGQTAGYLGRIHDPFVLAGDKETATFRSPNIEAPDGLSAERIGDRRLLLNLLDREFSSEVASGSFHAADTNRQRAFSLFDSTQFRQAIQLDREPETTRERYGRHLFGQGLLLARRLSEAGVAMVTTYWIDPTPPGPGGGEFDSHGRIYHHMRERLLPPTDQALAALFEDLHERGLLADTLVVVMSEFGRSPRINADAGRDHWPQTQSILLAGAGITGGTVFGATDRYAALPTEAPVTPWDLGQTILHALGIPSDIELRDLQNRPIPASRGEVIAGLLS